MDDFNDESEMTMTLCTLMRQQPAVEEKRRAMLQFTSGDHPVTFPLDSPQMTLGRGKDSDLCLPDHYLSGKHARILILHNFYYIQDMDSRNGTTVNGKPVKFLRLAHQDVIRVGQTELRFILLDTLDDTYSRKLNLQAVQSLALAVEAKDPYTKGHSERVAEISEHLAVVMGLSHADADRIRIAGVLHDIGKIGVPEAVLQKQGKLTDAEYEVIRKHPVDGHNILSPLNFLTDILPAVYHHHERYDGKGYPGKLAGAEIPLWARIIQVADTFDAMTTNRPYRKAFDKAYATGEVVHCAGTQFDPAVSQALAQIMKAE